MTKTISLQDADRSFARCIQDVEAGEDILITRDGKPVARLSRADTRTLPTPEQTAAWEQWKAAMERGWDIGASRFDRDSLHER